MPASSWYFSGKQRRNTNFAGFGSGFPAGRAANHAFTGDFPHIFADGKYATTQASRKLATGERQRRAVKRVRGIK